MKLKVSSNGAFSARLAARISAWGSQGGIGFSLRTPPELKFLYINEHGSPEHTIPGDPMIAFVGEKGLVMSPSVTHPGTQAKHTVYKAEQSIQEAVQELVGYALEEGGADNPSLVKEAVREAMDQAVANITEGLREDLPGHHEAAPEGFPLQGGKLKGAYAADVFLDLVEIIDNNE